MTTGRGTEAARRSRASAPSNCVDEPMSVFMAIIAIEIGDNIAIFALMCHRKITLAF
jgi:hypothetical protein